MVLFVLLKWKSKPTAEFGWCNEDVDFVLVLKETRHNIENLSWSAGCKQTLGNMQLISFRAHFKPQSVWIYMPKLFEVDRNLVWLFSFKLSVFVWQARMLSKSRVWLIDIGPIGGVYGEGMGGGGYKARHIMEEGSVMRKKGGGRCQICQQVRAAHRQQHFKLSRITRKNILFTRHVILREYMASVSVFPFNPSPTHPTTTSVQTPQTCPRNISLENRV